MFLQSHSLATILLWYCLQVYSAIVKGQCPENTFQCEHYIGHILPPSTDYSSGYDGYDSYSMEEEKDDNSYPESPPLPSTLNEGYCVPKSSVCDGKADCSDCSDEKNCSNSSVFWCVSQPTVCFPLSKLCNNRTDCPDGSDECDCSGSIRCEAGSSDKLCVPSSLVCDDKADCLGREDEVDARCDVFVCPVTGKRLMWSEVCDGKNNCLDIKRSDECNCSFTFVCGSGECIHNSSLCDGNFDCRDGSDECDCPPADGQSPFRCHGSGKCIAASQVCDGKVDCGSYLAQASNKSLPSGRSTFYVMDCSDETEGNCSTHFMCRDVQDALKAGDVRKDLTTCVESRYACDGTGHCDDRSDECECSDSVRCPGTEGNSDSQQCILRSNICDATAQCEGSTDELNRGFGFKCRLNYPNSLSRPCILPQNMMNDGIVDCSNDADECYRNGRWRCFLCFDQSMLISADQVCDGIIDCPDLSDECACDGKQMDLCDAVCANDTCQLGTIRCSMLRKVDTETLLTLDLTFSHICDGIIDCVREIVDESAADKVKKHLDEDHCGRTKHHKDQMRCPAGGTVSKLRPLYATRCDQRPECAGFADECDLINPCEIVPKFCENVSSAVDARLRGEKRFPCSSGVLLTSETDSFGLPGALVCDGRVDCDGIGEDEIDCPKRIMCDAGDGRISIDESQRCDEKIDCKDKSDEMECPEYFYCENGDPLFVSKTVRFDGNEDCSDKSDECPKEQLEGTFASITEMIASPFLNILVWIMAATSIIGNLTVIVYQIYVLFKTPKLHRHKVAMCNRVMLLNLACADLLTGLYLLILAVKTVQFSGIYCVHDKLWRTSEQCANLGFLNSIATEVAVVILVIMTTYRLCAVYRPFETASLQAEKVALLCACSWIVVVLTMSIPRWEGLADIFCEEAWLPLPFFLSDIVNREQAFTFIKKFMILTRNLTAYEYSSWSAVESFVKQGQFNESTFVKFGYYSQHSVCIPNMLASSTDSGVGFSATVTTFNFVAFVYVVVAYIYIYKGAVDTEEDRTRQQYPRGESSYVMRTQSSKPLTGGKAPARSASFKVAASKAAAMQARIFRLVASNLACWLPLTIMALLKLFGVSLPDDIYAIAAIVLLPITSALNPLLYSNFASVAWKYVRCKWCKSQKPVLIDNQEQTPFTEPTIVKHTKI